MHRFLRFPGAFFIVCFWIVLPTAASPSPGSGSYIPLGLPSSRSPYPVFNRYASLPPFTGRLPGKGDWFAVPSLELSQTMVSYRKIRDGVWETAQALDFETLSLEMPVSYGLNDLVSLELDLQVQYLWGGFLDRTIEWWHALFGFPNSGREYFPANEAVVHVPTRNGFTLVADGPAFLLSDPVLGVGIRLMETPAFAAAGRCFAAIPAGLGKGLAGSDLPQVGAGAYAAWYAAPGLTLTASAGAVLPLETFGWSGTSPYPVAQFRLSAIAGSIRGRALFADLNLKTSPLSGHVYDGDTNFFAKPNADLLIGLVLIPSGIRRTGGFRSFAVREGPFSGNGSDIGFIASGTISGR